MGHILLKSMEICNFKGCRFFVVDFGGHDATVYGDNGTGKTTLLDALSWLLFGKDGLGQTSFEIKPLSTTGEVLDHGAVTSVQVVLSVDGVACTLKKTFFERWGTKRGSASETFDGHTSEFFWNGVPLKKGAFDTRVSDMIPEEQFRMLTSVSWFCDGMPWKKRREILCHVCGTVSDLELMGQEARFLPLLTDLGSLTVDEYKAKMMAQRKSLNGARDTIPARMDECKKSVANLSTIDFQALEQRLEEKTTYLAKVNEDILRIETNQQVEALRNQAICLDYQLSEIQMKNQHFRQQQLQTATVDHTASLELDVAQAKDNVDFHKRTVSREEQLVLSLEGDVARLRQAWKAKSAEVLGEHTCSVCGQALPAHLQEQAQADFLKRKEMALQQIVQQADQGKTALFAAKERLETARKNLENCNGLLVQATERLEQYQAPARVVAHDLPDFHTNVQGLEREKSDLLKGISDLQNETATVLMEYRQKAFAISKEIEDFQAQLGQKGALEYSKMRLSQLMDEAKAKEAQLDAVDASLFLLDEFTRFKVQFLEESVNAKFSMVRFRLFRDQINGGLSDCCDVTVDGVPFNGGLNNGARIKAGMDVISTLSAHYGVTVPLFVDNAEAITGALNSSGQTIRLVVSEHDKKLRVEETYGFEC